MKTKYLILSVLLFVLPSSISYGQIPNSGFEEWINQGSYLNPVGWWTTNEFITTGSFYPVTRSTDHFPPSVGYYSIRLENNIALLPNWAAFGLTWTGDINGSEFPVFKITGHPTSLWGYYKFFPQNNDSMDVHIRLYKDGIDISGGNYKTSVAAPQWTPFRLDFSEYIDADSARIFMSTCYDNDAPVPHGNSVLYIDNLSLDSLITTGVREVDAETNIFVYPNPASEILTIGFSENIDNEVGLNIVNAFGQNMFTQNISNSISIYSINISPFQEGIYFVRVTIDKQITYNMKITVIR